MNAAIMKNNRIFLANISFHTSGAVKQFYRSRGDNLMKMAAAKQRRVKGTTVVFEKGIKKLSIFETNNYSKLVLL